MDDRYHLLAACMMHMEGYYGTHNLAFRNHNPGNLELPTGQKEVFPDALSGYTALVLDIEANIGKPLGAFISKYAPPSENDSAEYLAVVSKLSGIGPDEVL